MFCVSFAENDRNVGDQSMKKKYLYVSIMFFTSVFLFSQELILKVKNHANIIGWVYQKEKLENSYCLYDDNYLIFASSTDQQKPIIHVYKEHTSPIISGNFYISNTQFVALDDANTVLEAKFDDLENIEIRKVHKNLVAKSIALSPNDEMEVVGFANGFVQTHYLLRRTKKNFDVYFKAHNDSIYSINFNSMGQYFITSGKDEKLKIWNAKTLTLVKELPFYSDNLCPAIFSHFNDNFVYCTSRQTLFISDIEGKLQKEIIITDGIRLAKFTEKKDRIAVLTDSKKLEFYNITTGECEGTIPSLADICSFDIHLVTGAILLGCETGEIYLSSNKEIKNVALKKTLKNTKKLQENKTQVNKEVKIPELSTNILDYLGFEEDDEINESDLMKPFFPIKDETPLEEPITFTKKLESGKKVQTNVSAKTLDEIVLEDEIEFQKNATPNEEESSDEVSAIEEDEASAPADDESNTESQENEKEQVDGSE